jgi:hypothetical protein
LVEDRVEKTGGTGKWAMALWAARKVEASAGAGERHVEQTPVLIRGFVNAASLLFRVEGAQVHHAPALAIVKDVE